MVTPHILDGDLLHQEVEVIVNAWNRNIIPWWLLVPQGVSGAIKRHAGFQPFRELSRLGAIPLGGAVKTSAGRLPYKAIIHVAGISLFWRSSPQSIQKSVASAMSLVNEQQYKSVAFPIIGAGTGGFGEEGALRLMLEAIFNSRFFCRSHRRSLPESLIFVSGRHSLYQHIDYKVKPFVLHA